MSGDSMDLAGRVRPFLDGAKVAAQAVERLQAGHARRYAPDFNPFDFITGETSWSAVLAFLLDPNSTHGQGRLFLDRFIDHCGIAAWPADAPIRARTEVVIHNLRRIDVLAETVGPTAHALAIENKLWAADQERQLHDYARHLARTYRGRWHLVYLSPYGDEASESSREGMPDEHRGRIINCGYARGERPLADWLEGLSGACEAENIRWFVRQFKSAMQRLEGGTMSSRDSEVAAAITAYAGASEDNLRIVMQTAMAAATLAERIARDFAQRLQLRVVEKDGRLRFVTTERGWRSLTEQVPAQPSVWVGLHFAMESWKKRFFIVIQNGSYRGLNRYTNSVELSKGYQPSDDISKSIHTEITKDLDLADGQMHLPWWPWQMPLAAPLDNWLAPDNVVALQQALAEDQQDPGSDNLINRTADKIVALASALDAWHKTQPES